MPIDRRRYAPHLPLAVLAITLVCSGPPQPVRANTLYWNNAAGGPADVPTNWQPTAIPSPFDLLTYFIVPGAYTVDFPPSVPVTYSQVVADGSVTLTTSAPHTITHDFRCVQTGSLTLSGANVSAAWMEVDRSTGAGRFTVTSSPGFPSYPSRLEVTDTTASSAFGRNTGARIGIFGGSQLIFDSRLDLAIATAARCTIEVAGQEVATGIGSRLETKNPRMGQLFWPASGQVICTVSNGGVLKLAGETRLSEQGIGSIQIGVLGTLFNSAATFDGALYVGGNVNAGTPGGTATLYAGNGGQITANGPVTVGDPDGGGGSALTVLQGGAFYANQGLTVTGNGTFSPAGGLSRITGGAFRPNPNTGLALGLGGGTTNTPILWIANHTANTYISHSNGILIGGLGGGTLRVTGSGTTFGTTNNAPCGVYATAGALGNLAVDSLATFEPGGSFEIGGFSLGASGTSSLTVTSGGVVHALNASVGGANDGQSSATVKGGGSLLRYGSTLYVGGTSSGAAAPTTVTADSGGTISGAATGSMLVIVQAPLGKLVAAHGGSVAADSLRLLGSADLDRGTLAMTLVNVAAGAILGGRGSVSGSVSNGGIVRGLTIPLTRAELAIGGAYTQAAAGELRLMLGREGSARHNDTLAVAGLATLAGALTLTPDPSFHLFVGDTFVVVRYGTRSGAFSSITWAGNPASTTFDLVYLPDRLIAIVKGVTSVPRTGTPGALRLAVSDNAKGPGLLLELPVAAFVRVELFDIDGRRVATLREGELAAGRHPLPLPATGRGPAPGFYLARVSAGALGSRTARIVLLR